MDLRNYIIDVADFPKPGILFKDLSVLFTNHLDTVAKQLSDQFNHIEYDYVGGIDARGFIVGAALATLTNKKFLPIRKGGKLAGPKVSIAYQCEYHTANLEMNGHQYLQASSLNNRVLIVDDVLATGGTLKAAGKLCELAGFHVVGFGSIVNIQSLNQFEWNGLHCQSLIDI